MAKRISMNVSITAQNQKMVRALVRTGRYLSASEVFRAGLMALQVLEREDRAFRRMIADGIRADKRGEYLDGEAVFKRLDRLDAAEAAPRKPRRSA
jgi:putative addiction module CopG family antidote